MILEVTSVLFTLRLFILLPSSGVNVIVADIPSLTVNALVFPLTDVPLYVTDPLPVAFINNV